MDAFLAIADMLRALVQLRYMFAGLIVGALFSQIYTKFDQSAGDDAVYLIAAIGAVVGLVFDIRRGLKA
jgi:hypothetical protein